MGKQTDITALPTLTVTVCTWGAEGGGRVARMLLPEQEGVDYLVSWQTGEASSYPIPPEIKQRGDVKVVFLAGKGLSVNRNHALDHARGDVVLIADDDLRYYPGAFDGIRRAFASRPEMEYASFEYDSDVPKCYPEGEYPLPPYPKNYYQTSFEIALRRRSPAGRLRFPEQFGINAPRYACGEEELLLLRAMRKGVNVRHIPLRIAYHPGATTGVQGSLPKSVVIPRGVVAALMFRATAPLRCVLGGWRIWRGGQAPLSKAVGWMLRGMWDGYKSQSIKSYLNSPL